MRGIQGWVGLPELVRTLCPPNHSTRVTTFSSYQFPVPVVPNQELRSVSPQKQVLLGWEPQEGTGQPVLVTKGVGEEQEKKAVPQGLFPKYTRHSLPHPTPTPPTATLRNTLP